MPAPKKPVTFDEHLGAVIGNFARPYGGRPMLVGLLDWSMGTVNRRMSGDTSFTVRELEVVSRAIHSTPSEIVSLALRNFGGGDEQAGIDKLIRESAPMSEQPTSLADHRAKKSVAQMTDDEIEAIEEKAATYDPELEHDEPELP